MNSFTVDEDYAIIDYILDNKRYQQTGGNNVWKKAEEANICPGRSFWSLKERFRRGIIPNLKKYFLDKEIEKKLKKEYLEDQGDGIIFDFFIRPKIIFFFGSRGRNRRCFFKKVYKRRG